MRHTRRKFLYIIERTHHKLWQCAQPHAWLTRYRDFNGCGRHAFFLAILFSSQICHSLTGFSSSLLSDCTRFRLAVPRTSWIKLFLIMYFVSLPVLLLDFDWPNRPFQIRVSQGNVSCQTDINFPAFFKAFAKDLPCRTLSSCIFISWLTARISVSQDSAWAPHAGKGPSAATFVRSSSIARLSIEKTKMSLCAIGSTTDLIVHAPTPL